MFLRFSEVNNPLFCSLSCKIQCYGFVLQSSKPKFVEDNYQRGKGDLIES